MGRRTVFLIASVLIALVGTLLVFSYANNADKAAAAGQEPVEVLVATETIPAGTSASAIESSGDTELKTLPRASVPEGALSDLSSVDSLLNAVPIYEGQVLIKSQFTGSDSTTALTLPPGTMAMSVELEDPERVAGFLTPGSEVAVFATVELEDTESTERGRETDVIIDRVTVVAVGPSTLRPADESDNEVNSEDIPTAIITLAVTTDEGKRLAAVYSSGDLHFALLNSDSEVTNSAPVTGSTVLGG